MRTEQNRDAGGRFGAVPNTAPELELSPSPAHVEALRGTLQDFLENALPGFGFRVDEGNISVAVERMVDTFIDAHIDD